MWAAPRAGPREGAVTEPTRAVAKEFIGMQVTQRRALLRLVLADCAAHGLAQPIRAVAVMLEHLDAGGICHYPGLDCGDRALAELVEAADDLQKTAVTVGGGRAAMCDASSSSPRTAAARS